MTVEEIEKLVESRYPDKTPYTKEFIKKSIEKFGDIYSYEKTNRVDYGTKVTVTCLTHGDFEVSPDYFLREGTKGCRRCVIEGLKYTKEQFLENLYNKIPQFKGLYDFSESTDYLGSKEPIHNIKCLKHGTYFTSSPEKLISGKLSCHECQIEALTLSKRVSSRNRAIEFIKSHGINDFDFPEIDSYNIMMKDAVVTVNCKIHGQYKIPYRYLRNFLNEGRNPCSECRADEWRKYKSKYYYDKLVEIFADYDYDFTWILDNYKTEYDPILVKCNKHGTETWALVHNLLNGIYIPCPACRTLSRGEENVRVWLTKNNIDFNWHYRMDGVRKDKESKVVIDFYIPSKNLWIECNGPQHYRYVNKFQKTKEEFEDQLQRDQDVRDYCDINGINLIEIPYTYYKFEKIDYIMSQIFSEEGTSFDLGLEIPEIEEYPEVLRN